MVEIYPYRPEHEEPLLQMICGEGEEWAIYWREPNNWHYRRLLSDSITYVAMEDGQLCGYMRVLDDILNLYVCDLLVTEGNRGQGLGAALMSRLTDDYPDVPIYILSGNDEYYEHIGCVKEGSVYRYHASAEPAAPNAGNQ